MARRGAEGLPTHRCTLAAARHPHLLESRQFGREWRLRVFLTKLFGFRSATKHSITSFRMMAER